MRLGKYEAAPDDPQVPGGRFRGRQLIVYISGFHDDLSHYGDDVALVGADHNGLARGGEGWGGVFLIAVDVATKLGDVEPAVPRREETWGGD